jgi:calcium permeable stress-gated cation channel
MSYYLMRRDEEEDDDPVSLSGMISTLVPVLIISIVYLVIFLILRRSNRRFYAPRTYIGSLREDERSPSLPAGFFNWVGTFWKIPDVYALKHQSLDAYLFLRFLRMCLVIVFVGLCLTWPILFPINATGGGGQQQLDILSYSNIDVSISSGRNRLYAHAFVGWIFYGFVLWLIMRECIFYINLRQAFLLSPLYSKRISSRTVLFTSVPTPYLDEARIRKLFGEASVRKVWITSDTEALEKLVEERDGAAMKLEKAEVKLIKLANAERLKAIKGGAAEDKTPPALDAESGSVAARWIPKKKRPTHRTGTLGLIGKKVDTIEWCREELRRLIPLVDAAQADYRAGKNKTIPSVFVEFYLQSEAEAAFQVLTHHQALHMTPKFIGIRPSEVIWKSLRIPWWQKSVRRFAVLAFITALIIFWAIPVSFVATISQVKYLKTLSFLTWLDKVPPVIMGLITGLLPSVALAILMSLVPIIMRLCAKLAGEPSNTRVELFTQNAYFCFQLIQVFLVTTIASSASAAVMAIIDDPGSIFQTLSSALPKSSNFYISYFIVQGLTIATGVLTQVVGLVIFKLLYKFLAPTPRALYTKWTTLSAISWGSVLPVYTNIAVISIAYVVIAPLMLFWATIGLGLFYIAYRYNVLFVTDTTVDTRGLLYPRALKQLISGVYLALICMIGLFAVSGAIGPLILMIVFLIFTVLFHISLNSSLDPLLYNLPRSLQSEEESAITDLEPAVGVDPGSNGTEANPEKLQTTTASTGFSVADYKNVQKPGNFLVKFLKPWDFADYPTLRRLVPRLPADGGSLYTPEVEGNAYYPPAVTSETPLLWIPADAAGVSKQEIAHTSEVIPITDEGCTLNDQNKLEWDTEGARPPVWDEKPLF